MTIFWQLIRAYVKIGLFGFGGGYAMLSLVQNEVVGHGWITEQTFTDIVAVSQMTPGPIGINSATYIGYAAPASVNPELSAVWSGNVNRLEAAVRVAEKCVKFFAGLKPWFVSGCTDA